MEFYTEVKFMGDAYGANYGNGLSMCGSQSVQGFSRQKDDGDSETWTDNRNHKIVVHKNKVRDVHETKAIPLIAANLQRVIPPYQSQIWAALRKYDSESRLYYSLCSTFLGRMCLSGDIYDLSASQRKIVRDAMEFYKNVADVIRDGMTVKCEYTTKSYNNPIGSQLVIRTLSDVPLVVYHRFEKSEDLDKSFLEGKEILHHFGNADKDFSAEAWLLINS